MIAQLSLTLDRLVNPVFIKELRQKTRAKYYYAVIFAILGICYLFLFLGVIGGMAENLIKEDISGKGLFQFFAVFLGLPCFIAIPVKAFQAMKQEKDAQTFDLLILSGLTPCQILNGKLYSTLLDLLLFFSAISPYLVTSYFFGGVQLETILDYLIFTVAASTFFTLMAMAFSSASGQIGNLIRFFSIPFVISGIFSFIGLVESIFFRHRSGLISAIRDMPVMSLLVFFSFICLLNVLYQFNLIQLKYENDERTSGIKLAFTLLMVSIMITAGFNSPVGVRDTLMFSSILLPFVALFFVTEPQFLTVRQNYIFPKNLFGRLFAFFYYPGSYRGFSWLGLQYLIGVNLLLFSCLYHGKVFIDLLNEAIVMSTLAFPFYLVTGFYTAKLLPRYWQHRIQRIVFILIQSVAFMITAGILTSTTSKSPILLRYISPFFYKSSATYLFSDGWLLAIICLPLIPGIVRAANHNPHKSSMTRKSLNPQHKIHPDQKQGTSEPPLKSEPDDIN